MTTTAPPLPLTLTLPRDQRELVARLTDRMARKGHGMSKHAATATATLLADSDRMSLTYLEAVCVATAVRLWGHTTVPNTHTGGGLPRAWAAIERQLARPLAHPRYA